MKRVVSSFCALTAIGTLVLTSACGSKKPIEVKSPVLESAQRLEYRAAAAYAKGDHMGAAKGFQIAASVYESLAMTDALANSQLSLARIDADDGRAAQALARVTGVLSLSTAGAAIAPSTMLLAQGRAAALYMQQKNFSAAHASLTAAEELCTAPCEASSALSTLRANWHLAANDLTAAKTSAMSALRLASTTSDKANALRSLAQIGLAAAQYPQAIVDGAQALTLDQMLGASNRVIVDLDLLASLYNQSGNTQKATEYLEMSRAAQAARVKLGGQ